MFTVVLFSSLLFGCVTTEARNQESRKTPFREEQPKAHSRAEQEGYRISGSWEYRVDITHEGSKSEGKIGRLLFKGRPLGGCFDIIIIRDRVFRFVFRDHPWDFGGYREMEEDFPRMKAGVIPSADDISTGWFESGPAEDRPALPDSWVWVARGERSWYLDPEKLNMFIDQFDLEKRDSLVLPEIRR